MDRSLYFASFKKFDTYINVELCSSIKSIQYVTKYINKGSAQATFSIQSLNEVEKYQSGRYICSSKAVRRILRFSAHDRAPTIIHLAVHLENGQKNQRTNDSSSHRPRGLETAPSDYGLFRSMGRRLRLDRFGNPKSGVWALYTVQFPTLLEIARDHKNP
ncbi:hypothetical protein EVAR_36139_1 [Eumeta japonica]|uniref:Uncharacterized protein n=1 Tax=Eumeta variegata TaxID=151549 RepID=A0A4C1X5C8_EUMVA|nr:hypothetical protein EVAR_36139_1 [Eumeta japonica]